MKKLVALVFSVIVASVVADDDVTRFYSPAKPTYHQVERLIATAQAANGEDVDWPYVWTNRTIYSTPTYGQVERLIRAVQDGTNAPWVAGARYLSVWDCTTGLPLPNLRDTEYHMGDAYFVGNVTSSVDVTSFRYEHRLQMAGFTQGCGVEQFYCTNLVFSFTNNVPSPYTSFDPLVYAVASFGDTKDAIRSSGSLVRDGVVSPVYSVSGTTNTAPIHIMLADGVTAYGTDGMMTNATYLSDVVTRVDTGTVIGNRRPSGPSYVQGVPSGAFELASVRPNDTYYYDGTNWVLIAADRGVMSNELSRIAFTGVSVKVNGSTYNPVSKTGLIDLTKLCYKIKRIDPVTGEGWTEGDAIVNSYGMITLTIPKDKYYRRKTDKIDWNDVTNVTSLITEERVNEIISTKLSAIKINGQSLGPDVTITTYAPFKAEWETASYSGIDSFFSTVAADTDAKKGTAFLGALGGSSTPWGGGNAEAELKVMANTSGTLIYIVTVYSTDTSPYFWFNMSIGGGAARGWRKYTPQD